MTRPGFRLKRVYLAPEAEDGCRVLVGRLWRHGLARERAGIDLWCRRDCPACVRRHFPGKQSGFASAAIRT
jgi:uncharacterized protein YeaO (DUF488 family)